LTVSGAAAAFRNLEVGDQAPPIALKSLDGEEHSLGEKEGSGATIVLFWATWSPRSLVELGDLEKLRAEYGDKGLRILAVNVEGQEVKEEHRERIRSLVREKGFGFPLVMDDGLKTYNEWGVIATPTTAVLTASLPSTCPVIPQVGFLMWTRPSGKPSVYSCRKKPGSLQKLPMSRTMRPCCTSGSASGM